VETNAGGPKKRLREGIWKKRRPFDKAIGSRLKRCCQRWKGFTGQASQLRKKKTKIGTGVSIATSLGSSQKNTEYDIKKEDGSALAGGEGRGTVSARKTSVGFADKVEKRYRDHLDGGDLMHLQ